MIVPARLGHLSIYAHGPLSRAHGSRGIADSAIKAKLEGILQDLIAPIRQRRMELAQEPDHVLDVIRRGTEKAKVLTEATKREVIQGLGLFLL